MDVIYADVDLTYAKEHPDHMLLFNDNDTGRGKPNLRVAPNAIGIKVCKKPGIHRNAYYSDNNLPDHIKNTDIIMEHIEDLIRQRKYKAIVVPTKGIGSGMCLLASRAPDTYGYITKSVEGVLKYAKNYRKSMIDIERDIKQTED